MTTETRTTGQAHMRRVGPRTYEISSQTHPGGYHTYNLNTHECNCKAGQEGRFCWHWGAAKEADDFYARWRLGHGRDPDGCHFRLGMVVPGGIDGLREAY